METVTTLILILLSMALFALLGACVAYFKKKSIVCAWRSGEVISANIPDMVRPGLRLDPGLRWGFKGGGYIYFTSLNGEIRRQVMKSICDSMGSYSYLEANINPTTTVEIIENTE